MDVRKILDYIDTNGADYISLWRDVCNIESKSGDKAALDRVADTVEKYASSLGFAVTRKPFEKTGDFLMIDMNFAAPEGYAFLAHMDEPGLMLTEAQDEYFRFEPLGRIDPRVLSGRFVVLGDEQTRRKGLIAAKGIHLQDRAERRKIPKSDDLYIDIGAKDADDSAKMLSVGDLGVFDTPFAVFGEADGYFRGKALSGRVACAVLAELASALAKETPACTVSFLFLARCEAVPAAAGTALAEYTPDIAVLTDGVPADDMSDKPRGVTLGGGPAYWRRSPSRRQARRPSSPPRAAQTCSGVNAQPALS
mgnify:CR=1 FL=1